MQKLPTIPRLLKHKGRYGGMRGGLEVTNPDYYLVTEVEEYITAVKLFQQVARKLNKE